MTNRQWIILVISGLVLWFVAAIMIRVLEPMGALSDGARIITYIFVLPGTAPFIWMLVQLAGLKTGQVALGSAIVAMSAMFADGLALSWFPSLYADNTQGQAYAGAVILWGAAITIFLGFLFDRFGLGKKA